MRGAKTLHYGQNNINKMNIESKEVEIFASNEKVFGILSDCSNLSLNHIGEKIPNLQEWQASEKSCSFTVQGAGRIEIKIVEEVPFSKVVYVIGSSMTPQGVNANFNLQDKNISVVLSVAAELELPFFIAQMVKSKLKDFIDMLVDQIKIIAER